MAEMEGQYSRTDPRVPDLPYGHLLPGLPDLYSLDGYGIPWFYHMYPVPWPVAPSLAKGRSRSPRKFKPRKQRSNLGESEQTQRDAMKNKDSGEGAFGSRLPKDLQSSTPGKDHLAAPAGGSSGKANLSDATNIAAISGNAFSAQLDEVTRPTALRQNINTTQLPQGDLTAIRNVPLEDAQGHGTSPTRRQRLRQAGNGLYGGRIQAGVPLHATAPFPDPVAPMGRPSEGYGRYKIGSQACGTIYIEMAAEQVGGQACHGCQPDH